MSYINIKEISFPSIIICTKGNEMKQLLKALSGSKRQKRLCRVVSFGHFLRNTDTKKENATWSQESGQVF